MTNPAQKLRMGIMCHGHSFPAWAAECIEKTLELDFVEPVLLIRDVSTPYKPKSAIDKWLKYPYRLLFNRVYLRFGPNRTSMMYKNLRSVLGDVPMIDCLVTKKGNHSQYFIEEDVNKVKSYQPDFILRFGFNIIRGEILNAATYGVWSYHHSDEQVYRGGPAGFWEIFKGDPVTGAVLQKLNEKLDGGIILKKGWYKTIDKSWTANFDQILWGTTDWIKQTCIDIHNGHTQAFEQEPSKTSAPIYRFPNNWEMFVFIIRRTRNALRFHWNELFRAEKWNVATTQKSIDEILESGIDDTDLSWLPEAPAGTYLADPFISHGSILAERYSYQDQKGFIAQVPLHSPNEVSPAIEESFHLSYPFTFVQENKQYCIPEALENNSVTLYGRTNDSWTKAATLINHFPAVDPTLVHYNNKFWLFCTNQDAGPNTNLFLFHSENLEGPFKAHAANPVKCDIKSARPAGRIIERDGKLIRPAQDCSNTYGGRIVFNEIQKLTETEFGEKPIRMLEPPKSSRYDAGLHNIDHTDKLVCIDGKRWTFDFNNFTHVLKRKLSRLGK